MKKYLCLIALSLLTATTLSACNTAEGFGRDLQETGRAIDDAID